MLNASTLRTITLALVLATVALGAISASQPAWADEKKPAVTKPAKTEKTEYLTVTMSDALITSY